MALKQKIAFVQKKNKCLNEMQKGENETKKVGIEKRENSNSR